MVSLQSVIKEVCAKHRCHTLILYGSWARGDATTASDYDFLAIRRNGRDILHDARSWDLILIMRFASVGALRSYQQHPEHQKVMAFNQPFVADVATVDFE